MGGKLDPKWFPLNSFLVVKKVVNNRNCVELRKPKGVSTFKIIHFNNLRFFPDKKKPLKRKLKSQNSERKNKKRKK